MSADDLIAQMFEIIAEFDRDVADHLENESERADLWEDIDVPIRLFRQAALTIASLKEESDRLVKEKERLEYSVREYRQFSIDYAVERDKATALAASNEALRAALERFLLCVDQFERSDHNQADAYYAFVKGIDGLWDDARSALQPDAGKEKAG